MARACESGAMHAASDDSSEFELPLYCTVQAHGLRVQCNLHCTRRLGAEQ